MQSPDRQIQPRLRLVASAARAASAQPAARSEPLFHVVMDDRPRQQLLRAMSLAVAARDQAAHRLRTKLLVGRLAALWHLTLIAAVAAYHAFHTATHSGAGARAAAILILASSLALLAQIGQRRNDVAQADIVALSRTARRLAGLRDRLGAAPAGGASEMDEYRDQYSLVLRGCRAHCKLTDLAAARAAIETGASLSWPLAARYVLDVYGRDLALAFLPLLVLAFWV